VELLDSAYYLYAKRPLHLDEKAAGVLADGRARLAGIVEKLEAVSDWTASNVETVVREHAEAIGAKLGQVAQPLRAALTGRATSPGLFDVMAVLGRDETLSRLKDQLKDAPAA
jgi:glutamyl-tRNA synthetase